MSERDWEPGYKAVLIREETKQRLQQLRKALPDRDLNQERRLATAAVDGRPEHPPPDSGNHRDFRPTRSMMWLPQVMMFGRCAVTICVASIPPT